ncbi:MAG: phytanoyl-CoA dioxygenase [Deltaproteobacteria bacterium]|nr:phytanoyl-CoA dioxygenase [Deltaproteobacteria bacterium]
MLAPDTLECRPPTIGDRVRSRLLYWRSYSQRGLVPAPDEKQSAALETLRRDGFVAFPGYLSKDTLSKMQEELADSFQKLRFRAPALAQTRIDSVRHKELIDNFMFGTPDQLKEWNVLFERDEVKSYEQVIKDFNPSTLTVPMLQYSETYRNVWLDPFVLGIVANYLGMVPSLVEAYVRRNFPAPYRTMNHHWHRDLNSIHLLKAFVFLSDCGPENGPHEYIVGTHKRYDLLNSKRYFTEEEVNALYPEGHEMRKTSVVPAGTVVIEDTRGVHRAMLPTAGWRDLGFMVFMPLRPLYPHQNYEFPRESFNELSAFQQAFVPPVMLR